MWACDPAMQGRDMWVLRACWTARLGEMVRFCWRDSGARMGMRMHTHYSFLLFGSHCVALEHAMETMSPWTLIIYRPLPSEGWDWRYVPQLKGVLYLLELELLPVVNSAMARTEPGSQEWQMLLTAEPAPPAPLLFLFFDGTNSPPWRFWMSGPG